MCGCCEIFSPIILHIRTLNKRILGLKGMDAGNPKSPKQIVVYNNSTLEKGRLLETSMTINLEEEHTQSSWIESSSHFIKPGL